MKPRELKKDIYLIGAIDWDRRLFDSLIPLPDGTSYNSYLLKGEKKVALIDTVDPNFSSLLLKQLDDIKKIDYVISQHAEQDHSGAIPDILKKYPEAKVLTSAKEKEMLITHLHILEEKIRVVDDGEEISLGNMTLKFIYTPWVHWPETMVTYLKEERILFSCDFFGSHLATTDIFVENSNEVMISAKRYFAEIMMPFRNIIKKNIEKISKYKIDFIAPSHGPIYNNPDMIINYYKEWIGDKPKNLVVVPYISMHESTKEMVIYLVSALAERGLRVRQFELSNADIGKLAMDLVDAATIIIGTPTVLTGPHPSVIFATALANCLRPKARFISIIGSYNWGGNTVKKLSELIPNLKAEIIEPVMIKGKPDDKDFATLDILADKILDKHKEAGLFDI